MFPIMGKLKDIIFKHFSEPVKAARFETLTEYAPHFTPFNGGVYDQELTRAAIDRYATACSKLKPEVHGNAQPSIVKAIHTVPNEFQTWSQFLYRASTILECDCTMFVVKILAPDCITPIGFYTPKVVNADLYDVHGEIWVDMQLKNGEHVWNELENTLILTKFQYERDFFGAENCIGETMRLIHAQNQAQKYAIENGAKIRWIGAMNSMVRPEDIEKKRKEFNASNFTSDNESGLLLYDETFQNVKQVDQTSFTIDNGEMKRIEGNVFNYFGMNEKILRNEYDEEVWNAWYEGKIEPFAVQLGEGLTKLVYSKRERLTNGISFSSNRLQYASNKTKINTIRDLVDRGIISIEDAREILQLPREIDENDTFVIRGEYINTKQVENTQGNSDEEL